jgi:hypothetical protein
MRHLFATLGIGFCLCVALSCSGGGGGGTGQPIATAASSVSSGTITGFGSIKLVGKEYGTQNASFMVDGQPGSQSDLKVGMVVTVNGSQSSTGVLTATTVTQEDVVEGVIQSIPASHDRVVVLDQTVLIDNGTVFDNSVAGQNVSGLAVGDPVEINGFVKDKGVIIATLIEKKNQPASCQLTGLVENHNSGAQTFTIGGLTVTYVGAVFNDMPTGNTWNDLLVLVKGSPCTHTSQTFIATTVESDPIHVMEADEIEVEGSVTQFNSAGSFTVNGVPVVTNASTIFDGGLADDVAIGVEVEVEGSLANGILTASEVLFRDNGEIEGDVATVNQGTTSSLTVSGLSGITLFVDAQTKFKGGISNLSELSVGNHVRVRGRSTGTTTLIAADVEARSPNTRVTLQGGVQSIANPNVIILGVVIDTSPIADADFEGPKGPNGGSIGRAGFFNAVQPGTVVKTEGDLIGGVTRWSDIKIEREKD